MSKEYSCWGEFVVLCSLSCSGSDGMTLNTLVWTLEDGVLHSANILLSDFCGGVGVIGLHSFSGCWFGVLVDLFSTDSFLVTRMEVSVSLHFNCSSTALVSRGLHVPSFPPFGSPVYRRVLWHGQANLIPRSLPSSNPLAHR